MSVAGDVADWVDATWDLSMTVREWWAALAEAGWSQPAWPTGTGGRSCPARDARAVSETLASRGVIAAPAGGVGAHLAGPTILEHGTPDQIDRFLRPIADGTASWCQLFSEPGSGSDLAGLGTRAELDGDEWVVTGQKGWNSGADLAQYGLLLTRTDPDAPKHTGITYFLLDMDQPGVQVRPLRQMNGSASFSEVFLTEARIPAGRVVGELNGGWTVTQTTLRHERTNIGNRTARGLVAVASGPAAGNLDRSVAEVIDEARARRRSPVSGGAIPVTMMVELARRFGRDSDPVVRQSMARYHSAVSVSRWTNARIAAARGRLTGADGQLAKLATARICQESRDLSYLIAGAEALLGPDDGPLEGDLYRVGMGSPGARLGGGTDEIQRNVIGERALALPREPGPARDTPFRDLAQNA